MPPMAAPRSNRANCAVILLPDQPVVGQTVKAQVGSGASGARTRNLRIEGAVVNRFSIPLACADVTASAATRAVAAFFAGLPLAGRCFRTLVRSSARW